MMERLKKMPVPVLPTFVGTLTLSNVYGGMGYTWLRYLAMAVGTIVIICYIVKIIRYPGVCVSEYRQTVPASLYAGLTMCLMILGSFFYEKGLGFGKWIWLCAVIIHAVHICVFTYNNVIKKRDINTTVPSWFVTYNGIMVSCVTGGAMNMKPMLRVITIYGIIIYLILIPIMIWRLMKVPVKPAVYHTMPVVLAPCSLCVVSMLNTFDPPVQALLYFLYFCVLASLLFIIVKLPDFFSFDFVPGYAGLTFPMAIGIVATNKMAGYLTANGRESAAAALSQLSGFQIFLTSLLVGYVLVNFLRMLLRTPRRSV
ncbi:MAG: TDT family transporter [Lachnospiraceae bacterium]|nr:TDT family transporter [Lachnospiraceae bacterium]